MTLFEFLDRHPWWCTLWLLSSLLALCFVLALVFDAYGARLAARAAVATAEANERMAHELAEAAVSSSGPPAGTNAAVQHSDPEARC